MKNISLVLLLLISTSSFAAIDSHYVCVNGYLYKPSGEKEFVGEGVCSDMNVNEIAETKFPTKNYACINGYVIKPNGEKDWYGSNVCETAIVASEFACVNGYFYKPNSEKDWVGEGECRSARFGNGYACVGGYLYKPSSQKEWVGTSQCFEGNFGDTLVVGSYFKIPTLPRRPDRPVRGQR